MRKRYYWTITTVEHNGKDYYLVGHKDTPSASGTISPTHFIIHFLLVYGAGKWYIISGVKIMAEMNRKFKDSVFTYLFSDPKYMWELYLYLHPEDQDVTEAECKLVTAESILSVGQYNDLGIQLRDKLILLVEAQNLWKAFHNELMQSFP